MSPDDVMPPSEPSIDQAIDAAITAAFLEVAPEADLASLDPKVDFRSVLDIDSFDFLNLMLWEGDDVDDVAAWQVRGLSCVGDSRLFGGPTSAGVRR